MKTRNLQNVLVFAAAILLVSLSFSPTALAGSVYNVVNDFSISSNPNGPWSYLYDTGSGPQLITESFSNFNSYQGLDAWWNGYPQPYGVATIRNTNSSTVTYETSAILPPNLLDMDPVINKSDTTRWTAPTAGTWSIKGLFQGIDLYQNSHGVEILENSSKVLASGVIGAYGQQVTFDATVTLAKGDTIDFVVLGSPNYEFLSTGLSATIQVVPEPASLTLAVIAALPVIGYCWQRQRRRPLHDRKNHAYSI